MPSVRRASLWLSLPIGIALVSSAHGDPSRPDSDPCRGRHSGDACEADDFEGTCRRRRCTRDTEEGMRLFHCLVCESRRHGHHRRHRDASVGTTPPLRPIPPSDAATDVCTVGDATEVSLREGAPVLHAIARREPSPASASSGRLRCSTAFAPGFPGSWEVSELSLAVILGLSRRARRLPRRPRVPPRSRAPLDG